MSKHALAASNYAPQYPKPIEVRAGDVVDVGAQDAEFPQWRWCRSAAGLEGWMPASLLDLLAGNSARVREDYSAKELAITAGERLTVERRIGGWTLVRSERGIRGWVPDTHLAFGTDDATRGSRQG